MTTKCPKCNFANTDSARFCSECGTQLDTSKDLSAQTITLETPIDELPRGTLFAGRYEIIESLGIGGMGKVYKAYDKQLKEEVAIKLIKTEIASDRKTLDRFSNELKLARKIVHKNVGRMYELMENEGIFFITMEYIPGQDLKGLIRQSRQLTLGTAIYITAQICEGLTEAHKLGVVHRDLKPSNIMIDKDGNARIMDFGIARSLKTKGVTGEGYMIGTPEYMSPEQVEAKDVDQRSDLYSLGIILYEMVTGQLPFEGETPLSVAHKHKYESPQEPKKVNVQIPDNLNRVILKSLEKEKEKRYQSVEELFSELKEIGESIPTTERIVTRQKHKTKKIATTRWKRLVIYCGAGLLLILFISIGLYFSKFKKGSIDCVAVLPITIVGGDSSDQAFCHGLAETLTSKLIQLEQFQRQLFVLPFFDVREFEITSPSDAERIFRVTLAIKGSFKRIGDMFNLNLKLIDTKSQRELKSQVLTDHIANISTLQEDVIFKLVEMVGIEINPQIQSILTAGDTTIPGAYESYLQGLGYMERNEQQGNFETAISLFKQAVEQDPHYALAHAGLGKAYWRKYKLIKDSELLEKARLSCTKAIEISDNLASVHVRLGNIHRETDQYEEAINEYKQALSDDPVNFDALQELAEVYENLGKLEEAEETLKEAIKYKPSYWHGYSRLGYFYYIYGRNIEAEKMYRRSIDLMTENVLDYNNLIAIYYLLGQNDRAEAMFEKSIAIKPGSVAYSNMGTIYFFQRRYADALAMLEKAIKLGAGEDTHVIWANLADSYRYTPGYSEKAPEAYQHAIKLATKELEIDPGDAQLHSSLAVFYAKSGDAENALAEISAARRLASNDVAIILDCVLVFEIVNQRDQAIQALQEYIERGGSIKEVYDHPDLSGLRADPSFKQLRKE